MPAIEMLSVTDSQNVATRGYDPASKTMRITFKARGGATSTYEYKDIEPDLWRDFLSATSAGAFVAAHIRPLPCKKL